MRVPCFQGTRRFGLVTGGAEAGGAAGGFGEGIGFFKGGLDALHHAELGDAVARGDEMGLVGEVGEDDFELAAIARVDHAGESGDAAQSKAAAVFDEGTMGRGKLKGEAGADGLGGAGLTDGGEGEGFGGEQIGGKIAKGTDMGVAGKLGRRKQALDLDGRAEGGIEGHGNSDGWNDVS